MKKRFRKTVALMIVFSMCLSLMGGAAYAGESLSGKTSDIQIVQQGGKQYYLADPQEGDVAGPENFDVWTSKTIAGTENEDEFEVTLQVGSTVKAVPNDVAVVLVMDVSGSMMNDETGERWNWNNMPEGRKRRIEYTKEAAVKFAEAYVKDAGNSQRMLSVVQFGNHAQTVLPWTDVNSNGELKDVAKNALNSVQVNFTVDPARYYWDEAAALAKWSKVDYWDTTEVEAVMQDEFEDHFESFCQAASLTDRFISFLTTETVEQEIEGVPAQVEITSCTYPECTVTSEHTHCGYAGCAVTEPHSHCTVEGCVITETHSHCSKCDSTAEHMHCSYDGCTDAETHRHCGHEGCTAAEEHEHCVRCGLTDNTHTHAAGCTLAGCLTPFEGPHTHCCTHSSDTVLSYTKHHQSWVEYNYRCKNPDPTHSHEFWDSDRAYLTYTRYFGSVWCIGTNMEAGLLLSRNLVTSGLAEGGAIENIDDVYVILLSDGMPTWMTNETSETETDAILDSNKFEAWDAVKDIVADGGEDDIAIAQDIKDVAKLYAILYSSDLESKFSMGAGHPLNGVSAADWIRNSGDYYVGADLVVESPRAEDIENGLLQIKNNINLLSKAWMVNDELSSDVTFMEFTANGEHSSFTPAGESEAASIYWNIGRGEPDSGTGGMEDPYIYTMKYKVKLNSSEDDVKAASLAHDADSSLEGIYTGNDAYLQYFMAEKEAVNDMTQEQIQAALRIADFNDVSVKGLYGDLTFVKKHGETGEVMEGVGFTLCTADGKSYGSEAFTDSEGRVTFTDIPKNTYTLTETTVPEGMEQMDNLTLVESWGEFAQENGVAVPSELLNWPVGGETDPLPPNNPPGGDDPNPLPPSDPPAVKPPTEEPPVADEPGDLIEVPDGDIPMGELVEGDEPEAPAVEVQDEEIPLSDVPKTADNNYMMLWLAMAAMSVLALLAMRLAEKKEF